MKSLFEEMGGTYRQVGDYFIPNLVLPDDGEYQIGKYGRMRRNYLKEHRKVLYTNYVVEGTLFKPNGMGATHEQHPQPCGGNHLDRTCICLVECPLSAVWLITGIIFMLWVIRTYTCLFRNR